MSKVSQKVAGVGFKPQPSNYVIIHVYLVVDFMTGLDD